MKNVFKFGFLGLALTVGVAACNQTTTSSDAEGTADSMMNEIESEVGAAADSMDAMADSLGDTADSLGAEADSLVEETL